MELVSPVSLRLWDFSVAVAQDYQRPAQKKQKFLRMYVHLKATLNEWLISVKA